MGRVTGFWPGAPDLAVEVVSPHDTFSAVEEKTLAWLAAGAQAVWVVDPRQQHIWYETCLDCNGSFFDAGEFRDLAHETISDFFKGLVKIMPIIKVIIKIINLG